MSTPIATFQIPSVTCYKPKVLKSDDFSKLSKEGQRQLSFYPTYIEVCDLKKGKPKVIRMIKLADVTDVTTAEARDGVLRVFANRKGKIECHQMIIPDDADFQQARAYFDRNAAVGSIVSPFPSEAIHSLRRSSQAQSKKSTSKRPAASVTRKPREGHESVVFEDQDSDEPSQEPSARKKQSKAHSTAASEDLYSDGRSHEPSIRKKPPQGRRFIASEDLDSDEETLQPPVSRKPPKGRRFTAFEDLDSDEPGCESSVAKKQPKERGSTASKPTDGYKPRYASKKTPKGRGFAASHELDMYKSKNEPKNVAYSVSTVQYDEKNMDTTVGQKPSVSLSFADEVPVTAYREGHQGGFHTPTYAYGGGDGYDGEDIEGEPFRAESGMFSRPRHYSQPGGGNAHRRHVRESVVSAELDQDGPVVFTEEDFRHLLLTPAPSEAVSEGRTEACSTCYGDTAEDDYDDEDETSEEPVIAIPRRPKSLPYYSPFVPHRPERKMVW